MRRSVIWIIALCLAAILPMQAMAAVETAVHASASAVKPGEQMVFTVTVDGAGDISSMAVLPLYDANSFTLIKGEWLLAGTLSDFDMETGLGVIALVSGTQVNTKVFQFTLEAKENATLGTQKVGCTVVLMDDQSQRSELTATEAQIQISHDAPSEGPILTGGSEPFPWLWVGVGAGVSAALLAVVAVVLRKKNKK